MVQQSVFAIALACIVQAHCAFAQEPVEPDEQWRPRLHFAPKKGWINDPNGMVYHKGVYHLFFQHYPDGNQWGPMHWGHATSTDLVNWEEQSIKLYPDSLGYIFSGSAVFDSLNTSGLGTAANPPLVAIFTHHDPKTEKTTNTFQNQSIAYSLDNGNTWTKYPGNPVLRNTGIVDFRDPKVMWYAPRSRWIMTLATKDRITFYSSPNLLQWEKESEFGATHGAHGGVWECPDLVPMSHDGKTYWVLLVNLNPGGPNGGSATQYFIGDFDGKTFTASHTDTRWVDYGPDEYAGISWSNTGNRVLFIGWMSNWDYANHLPTQSWRNAMTVVREVSLRTIQDTFRLISQPVPELSRYVKPQQVQRDKKVSAGRPVTLDIPQGQLAWTMDLDTKDQASFHVRIINPAGEEIMAGYDARSNTYFIDRGLSGKVRVKGDFSRPIRAPRFPITGPVSLKIIADASSIELFADNGATILTALYFPSQPPTRVIVASPDNIRFRELSWSILAR
jgi:fructan beta-fructosidase